MEEARDDLATEITLNGVRYARKSLLNSIKLLLGMVFLFFLFIPVLPVMVVLLPWRKARIILTDHLGTVIGWTLMKLSRCPITVEGREHFDGTRPAICVGNHTSIVDAFTSIWLVPPGTVGVAKKQILYYPFYGQIWYLSGHLTLDRANTEKAKASMCKLADYVRRKKLQVLMWPEGTRARDGRLLPFKKGFVHLALATGLPIVPMVTTGAHRVWDKGSLKLREVPISIRFLPAIDTSSWSLETISDHVQQVWKTMHDALPSDQRPSPRKS